MEEQKNKRRRLWRLIPLGLLLLAAGAAALLYLVGIRGVSAVSDDPDALLRSYDPEGFSAVTLLPDGRLELTLEKPDLIWFAWEYDLAEPVRDWLDIDDKLLSGGFRLSGGEVILSVRRRAGGLLPLSYRARAGLTLRDKTLWLETREVSLGSRIRLGESQWPPIFRQPLRIDLSHTDFAPELLSAELSGSALRLRLAGLTAPGNGRLVRDEALFDALRMFGLESGVCPVPWEEGKISAAVLCAQALSGAQPREYLARAMSLCPAEELPALWGQSSAIARRWLWEPLREQAGVQREELEKRLAERQSAYEKLLRSVREICRSGAMGIGETGFYNPATGEPIHPGTLSRLPVTAIDSRIVFLTTRGYEADPRDMPDMLALPKKSWLSMDKDLDWKADVDLGVLLTTEGEVPILLYRRLDGTMVLREVTEELYVSVLVSRTVPQLDLDALPPVRERRRGAGEGFSAASIAYLIKEEKE